MYGKNLYKQIKTDLFSVALIFTDYPIKIYVIYKYPKICI